MKRSTVGRRVFAGAAAESGQALVITVLAMIAVIAVASYAIDTAIWYVHGRHLQTQVDAAAFAGAQDFQYPCSAAEDTLIKNRVLQYDGSTGLTNSSLVGTGIYNQQVPKTPTPATTGASHNLVTELNQSNYYNQSIPGDSEANAGKPCEDGYVDVKASETNLPSVLSAFAPPYINKQARVSIEQQTSALNVSAFVEPIGPPNSVTAQLVQEDGSNAGTSIGSSLTLSQSQTNPNIFSGTTTLPSTIPSNLIGTKVTLTGGDGSTTFNHGTTPPYGIAYSRLWPAISSITAAPNAPPQVSDMWVIPTTGSGGPQSCSTVPASSAASNFLDNSTATSVYLCATMSFNTLTGTNLTCSNAAIAFSYGSTTGQSMNCPSNNNPDGTWQSNAISLPASSGGTRFSLTGWTLTAGALPTGGSGGSSGTCVASPKSKNCTGTFSNADQEVWTGGYDETTTQSSSSGPVVAASISNSSGNPIQSESQTSAAGQSVTISVQVFSVSNETSISSEGPSVLGFGANQQNFGLGCNGQGNSNTLTAIAGGCHGNYTLISGTESCSNVPQPYCAGPASTGNKFPSYISEGMNDRVYCGGVTTGTCDSTVNATHAACPGDYNYWDTSNALNDVLNQSPPDPRLLTLFITGFDDNAQNGNTYFPIEEFAEFYVTGWSGDPCLPTADGGNGSSGSTTSNGSTLYYTTDDYPPGGASGDLMGHFVKYVQPASNGGGGGTLCTQNTFGNCIPVATK